MTYTTRLFGLRCIRFALVFARSIGLVLSRCCTPDDLKSQDLRFAVRILMSLRLQCDSWVVRLFLGPSECGALSGGWYVSGRGCHSTVRLLPRIFHRITFSHPNFGPLLCGLMLDEDFTCIFCFPAHDESWIPKFTRNTQVLAASHHGI